MGLTGVALPVTVMLAAVATLRRRGRHRSTGPVRRRPHGCRLVGVLASWGIVVVLGAPTLAGMVTPRDPGDGVPVNLLAQDLWYGNHDPAATAPAVMSLVTPT